MLGHPSAAMALETYADRFDDERDAVEHAPDPRNCLTCRHRPILAPDKGEKALKFRAFCGFRSAVSVTRGWNKTAWDHVAGFVRNANETPRAS